MKTKIFAWLLVLVSMPSLATVVTFDDLNGSGASPIADGYAGFNWSNGADSIGAVAANLYPQSGYAHGTVSPGNSAFNFNGSSGVSIDWASGGSFNFIGAFFTSAWFDQEIAFEGYKAGNLVYASDAYQLNTQSPQWIDLQWADIDSLVIYNTSWQWAMDNFTYTSNNVHVPESSPLLLLLLGGAMLLVRRKLLAA